MTAIPALPESPPFTPLSNLARRLGDGTAIVGGVLSGTSVDGIDVALVRFGRMAEGQRVGRPEVLAFETRPFPEPLGSRLRSFIASAGGDCGLGELAFLSRDLGQAFGSAVRATARERSLLLDLVGSHGQTVWHHDGVEANGAMTLQLGDGDHVAAVAGSAVVSDFRCADVAAGGAGAPLSALVDDVLFEELPRPAAVLNLGGIANLTLMGESSGVEEPGLMAFDVGPAGALLDGLARARLGQPFDEGGKVAAGGKAHENLVAELLAHPFFDLDPPKSTGRDTFGQAYLRQILKRAEKICDADLLASASSAVGRSILDALERWSPTIGAGKGPRQLVVAGGGVHHQPLLATLAMGFSGQVKPAQAFGVDPDAREALCFAILAARFVRGEPSTHPGATGARAGRILGKFSPA